VHGYNNRLFWNPWPALSHTAAPGIAATVVFVDNEPACRGFEFTTDGPVDYETVLRAHTTPVFRTSNLGQAIDRINEVPRLKLKPGDLNEDEEKPSFGLGVRNRDRECATLQGGAFRGHLRIAEVHAAPSGDGAVPAGRAALRPAGLAAQWSHGRIPGQQQHRSRAQAISHTTAFVRNDVNSRFPESRAHRLCPSAAVHGARKDSGLSGALTYRGQRCVYVIARSEATPAASAGSLAGHPAAVTWLAWAD